MKPIPGETVQSILRGPANAGHIREMSQFLRRKIDVWADDRVILFDSGRQPLQPRLDLVHEKVGPSSSGLGHFKLLDGSEPRNAEAGRRPNNCAFDCVSDQTGYPATTLRQIVAQRMLVKLYHARLRGRDYQFQCSRCSISGGEFDETEAMNLLHRSNFHNTGHLHIDDQRHCNHRRPEQMRCMHCFGYIKVRESDELTQLPIAATVVTIFSNYEQLKAELIYALNLKGGKEALQCLESDYGCPGNGIYEYECNQRVAVRGPRVVVVITNIMNRIEDGGCGYRYIYRRSERGVIRTREGPCLILGTAVSLYAAYPWSSDYWALSQRLLYLTTIYPILDLRTRRAIMEDYIQIENN